MIIWIASYPRSGNTMFRMMLRSVFDCKTYKKTYKPAPNGKDDIREATGQTPLPAPWTECRQLFIRDSETHLVKTHDAPEDSLQAIYIVRNGFASIRSYKSYLRDFHGLEYSLEQIILGEPQFRSWGWHLDAWNPIERPNTLLLKYEDLVERPEEQIERIADFTGFIRQGKWVNEFDQFHARNPKLFRQGHGGDPSADFSEAEQQLFWALHGDWMLKLGYCTELPAAAITHRALRQKISDHLQNPVPTQPTNGHANDEKYRRLRKHWWTKLGRKVGALSKKKTNYVPPVRSP
jgi:hypothetical protein